MVAGLDIEFEACRHSDCKTTSPVYAARTYTPAPQNGIRYKSVLARISPPPPGRNARGARWHCKVLQFGFPVVPTPASNGVITETFSFLMVHIVNCQSVDVIGRVDRSCRTNSTWRCWR